MSLRWRVEKLEGSGADRPVVVAYLDGPDALTAEEECAAQGVDPRQAHCITVEYISADSAAVQQQEATR